MQEGGVRVQNLTPAFAGVLRAPPSSAPSLGCIHTWYPLCSGPPGTGNSGGASFVAGHLQSAETFLLFRMEICVPVTSTH